MKRIFGKAALLLAFGFTASTAAAETINLGAIELGRVYQIPDYAAVTGTFTAPATGTLTQNGVPDVRIQGLESTAIGYGPYGMVLEWQVTEGTTYTVSSEFVMSGGNLQYNMAGAGNFELALESASPEDGGTISTNENGTGEAIYVFNTSVQMTSASIRAGSSSISLTNTSFYPNSIVLPIKEAMMQLYSNGSLKPEGGDAVDIVIEGIRSLDGQKYNGTGTLVGHYISAPKAITLVSTNFSDYRGFKSYYPVGDPEGVLTFTFDGDLSTTGIVLQIMAGNPEVPTFCYEELPVKISGNTATANLCGQLRDFTRAISDGGYVSVSLINVKDSQGNIATGQDGHVGSFPFTFLYDYIQPFDVTSEFSPVSGSDLAGVDKIEIWFNHADMLTFNGVSFVWGEGKRDFANIPVNDLDIDSSIATERVILVNVPEEAKTRPTTVKLYGLVGLDGYDHTAQIMAEYNQFVVTLISPFKPGQAIASTGTSPFIVTINREAGYMRYDFFNSDGESCGGEVFSKQDNGTWTAANINAVCYSDFAPYMVVSAYESEETYTYNPDEPVGTYKIAFVGTSSPFEYSVTTFTGVDPADGSEISVPVDADFCFEVSFDGLVVIDSGLSGIMVGDELKPFSGIEGANQGEDSESIYANCWKLYPDASINTLQEFSLVIAAFDEEGYLVEGTTGGAALDRIVLTYTTKAGGTTGIESVVTDNCSGDVYNLQGMRVLRASDGADVSRLQPGIYIVDGKKTLVK